MIQWHPMCRDLRPRCAHIFGLQQDSISSFASSPVPNIACKRFAKIFGVVFKLFNVFSISLLTLINLRVFTSIVSRKIVCYRNKTEILNLINYSHFSHVYSSIKYYKNNVYRYWQYSARFLCMRSITTIYTHRKQRKPVSHISAHV